MIGVPARASPDCYRGRRDLLQRLFELIKMRVALRCPNLAHRVIQCEAEFDRYRGKADIDQAAPISSICEDL